ncbi:MAG: hypothetical protein ACK6DZ_11170 [Acidobacteriota bacterium]
MLALIEALHEYIDLYNENPKPFICTAKANDIHAKGMRAKASVLNGHSV